MLKWKKRNFNFPILRIVAFQLDSEWRKVENCQKNVEIAIYFTSFHFVQTDSPFVIISAFFHFSDCKSNGFSPFTHQNRISFLSLSSLLPLLALYAGKNVCDNNNNSSSREKSALQDKCCKEMMFMISSKRHVAASCRKFAGLFCRRNTEIRK